MSPVASSETQVLPAGEERRRRKIKKNAEIRRKIVVSAAELIGIHGYPDCSVARITERAGISHGAFYQHFESRQSLFDILLLELGAEMLHEIGVSVRGLATIEEVERQGLIANVQYLVQRPYMWRVTLEAPVFAPTAYEAHLRAVVKGYVRSFRRFISEHRICDEDLEEVAVMLAGARSYLLTLYCVDGNNVRPLTESRINLYMDTVSSAFAGLMAKSEMKTK